ncbi:hypothetical protein BCY88_06405 [Paraburkholderia fungorum]|uniref:Uncharacterized protein n=1 Tax=Paraburkholderia fungorum TaxID=134537 RepID=A0A3R7I8K7_9BURK|nr:hypothetical protein BCY88_06405 [Paraburkholderia fungorum]
MRGLTDFTGWRAAAALWSQGAARSHGIGEISLCLRSLQAGRQHGTRSLQGARRSIGVLDQRACALIQNMTRPDGR